MTMHFVDQGSSDIPLILLHAYPLNHSMWKHQIAELSKSNRVIAVDLSGFGKTPTLQKEAKMGAYVQAIREMMDNNDIEKAVLGGCSMGGYILFEFWRLLPEMAAGLILCDTKAEADGEQARNARMDAIDTIREEGLEPVAESMIPKLLSPKTIKKSPAIKDELEQIILNNSPIGVIHAQQAMASRADSTETLAQINVPTLVIVGEDDGLTPPEVAKSMADSLPHAEYHVISQAGHLSPLEQPHKANQVIADYMKKHFSA